MKIIIGVILGIFIVFNWGSIRNYFDHKISNPTEISGQNTDKKTSPDGDKSNDSNVKKADQQPKKNTTEDEKGSDSFKDFK